MKRRSCSKQIAATMTSVHFPLWLLLQVLSLLIVACDSDGAAVSLSVTDRRPEINQGSEMGHTVPTLLSVVNPVSREYIKASDNPLYGQWYQASVLFPNQLPDEILSSLPQLSVDTTRIARIRDPLTLSWNKVPVQPDDVLVLHCGDYVSEITKASISMTLRGTNNLERRDNFQIITKASMMEIATIAQAQATSYKHGGTKSSSWFIPNFPVTKYDVCQFVLYRNEGNREKVGDWTNQLEIVDTRSLQDEATAAQFKLSPVAISDTVDLHALKNIPTQLHLAFGDTPKTMVAQFTTAVQGTPVATYYETHNGMKGKKVSGTSHTYTADDMCGAPANLTQAGCFQPPGMLHVVEMTNLKPDTRYSYKVGLTTGQGIVWGDLNDFVSPPVVGTSPGPGHNTNNPRFGHHRHHFNGNGNEDNDGSSHPYSYVVYGDQGCPSVGWGEGGQWVAAMVGRELTTPSNNSAVSISSIHHFGDLSYARGTASIWDEWFTMMEPIASRVPLMIGVGNHEYDHKSGGENGKDPSGVSTPHGFMPRWGNMGDDSSGECGVPTSQRFQMPRSTDSNGVFWYSYDYATTHTTVISSEHDLSRGSPQHTWLVQDLESVNRTETPWLVVEVHRPFYNAEMDWDDYAVGVGMRMEMEHLLRDYQVDIVFAGHYHSYFRSCDGLFRSVCNNNGPIHITVGTAGASLESVPFYKTSWSSKNIIRTFGYGRVTVMNSTALHFEFVKAGSQDDPDSGKSLDHIWITRNRLNQF